MAPNPIMIPRERRTSEQIPNPRRRKRDLTWAITCTSFTVLLAATLPWARRWVLSGAAVESLLLIYGTALGSRIFPTVPLWTLLASLNLIYAVASTSWLLHAAFTALCYPYLLITCLFEFDIAADFARKRLRKLLVGLHFVRDKIAMFNLPALEIDTDVNGLLVIRGVTFSLSSLRLVAHGIELGLKMTDDIELALYADYVDVQLFRRIVIGDVYGNVKGGKAEMTFGDLETVDTDDDSIFQFDSSFLRAATASSASLPNQTDVKSSMTGGRRPKDSSLRESLGLVATVVPEDDDAEVQYSRMLEHIEKTSHVYEAAEAVRKSDGENAFSPENEKDMRAAVCAKLQEMPSVPNPPMRSIRVTTLQNLSKPAVREFLHRLPFLLRALLMPLSYFHPITISSISASGSGEWLTTLLQQEIFKHYASQDAELRRLERKISRWLASANFCLQLVDIGAMGSVPLNTEYDIYGYLNAADIMVYRTVPQSGVIAQVARLGGLDGTVTLPSFLLPHHEHLLPPVPTSSAIEEQAQAAVETDGMPKTIQMEHEVEKMKKDEVEITASVHAKLPACVDQSLLNFIAALIKATKVIELEKANEEVATEEDLPTPKSSMDVELPPVNAPIEDMPIDSPLSASPSKRTGTGFKTFATGIRQNLKDARMGEKIKEAATNLHQATREGMQATREGMKRAAVTGLANDRWIARIVGKVAAKLEQAQGDLGYSGGIPVPLAPYRPVVSLPSKLLP